MSLPPKPKIVATWNSDGIPTNLAAAAADAAEWCRLWAEIMKRSKSQLAADSVVRMTDCANEIEKYIKIP